MANWRFRAPRRTANGADVCDRRRRRRHPTFFKIRRDPGTYIGFRSRHRAGSVPGIAATHRAQTYELQHFRWPGAGDFDNVDKRAEITPTTQKSDCQRPYYIYRIQLVCRAKRNGLFPGRLRRPRKDLVIGTLEDTARAPFGQDGHNSVLSGQGSNPTADCALGRIGRSAARLATPFSARSGKSLPGRWAAKLARPSREWSANRSSTASMRPKASRCRGSTWPG